MVWLGSSKLPGTWKASQPPGATASTSRGSRSRWPGTHCSAALETSTSTGSAGAHVGDVADGELDTPSPTGAAATISALESTPSTCACGQRRASSTVRLPAPQPRSTTGARCLGIDPGDQLEEGPAALVGEGEVAVRVPAVRHRAEVISMSRILSALAFRAWSATRSTSWSRPGTANAPTSTWPRSRCSAGSAGWPGCSTRPGARRSPPTRSRRGSSTCSPRCVGPASPTSSPRARCCGRRWSPAAR